MARISRDGESISLSALILSIIGTSLLWLVELKLTWALGFWLFNSEMGAAATAICFFVGMGSKNGIRFS